MTQPLVFKSSLKESPCEEGFATRRKGEKRKEGGGRGGKIVIREALLRSVNGIGGRSVPR
jgi:hypothetical protein